MNKSTTAKNVYDLAGRLYWPTRVATIMMRKHPTMLETSPAGFADLHAYENPTYGEASGILLLWCGPNTPEEHMVMVETDSYDLESLHESLEDLKEAPNNRITP